MALTPSKMVPLKFRAPEFELPDTDGAVVRLGAAKGRHGTVVMFICNHCPYVKHLKSALVAFAREAMAQGVAVIAINSNDAERYPDDSPERMAEEKRTLGYPFPYLFDATQDVARAYDAACTPDFYLFDGQLELVYRGQFDDSRPGNNIPVTGKDLREAVHAIVNGSPVPEPQKPSVGCNIKWKL